jgi:hypothetical protein
MIQRKVGERLRQEPKRALSPQGHRVEPESEPESEPDSGTQAWRYWAETRGMNEFEHERLDVYKAAIEEAGLGLGLGLGLDLSQPQPIKTAAGSGASSAGVSRFREVHAN